MGVINKIGKLNQSCLVAELVRVHEHVILRLLPVVDQGDRLVVVMLSLNPRPKQTRGILGIYEFFTPHISTYLALTTVFGKDLDCPSTDAAPSLSLKQKQKQKQTRGILGMYKTFAHAQYYRLNTDHRVWVKGLDYLSTDAVPSPSPSPNRGYQDRGAEFTVGTLKLKHTRGIPGLP